MASKKVNWFESLAIFGQKKKCNVKTLDTVFIDSTTKEFSWFFTNKHGYISKKKSDNCSVSNIIDRFSRFALSNPFNTLGNVAFIAKSGVKRSALTQQELGLYLEQNSEALSADGCFLQVFLRPHRGNDSSIVCTSVRMNGERYEHKLHTEMLYESDKESSDAQLSEAVKTQVLMSCEHIYQFFRSNGSLRVENATVEFIVDDNEQAWLSQISDCVVVEIQEDSHPEKGGDVVSRLSSPLQQLRVDKNSSDGGSSPVRAPVPIHASTHSTASTSDVNDASPSTKEDPGMPRGGVNVPTDGSKSFSPKKQRTNNPSAKSAEREDVADSATANKNEGQKEHGFVEHKDGSASVPTPGDIRATGRERKPGDKRDVMDRKKGKVSKQPHPQGLRVGAPTAAASSAAYTGMAKTGPTGTDSGFRRSKMDEPPSVDLLAKFAVERDRQEQARAAEEEAAAAAGMFGALGGAGSGGKGKGKKGKKGADLRRANANRQQMGLGLGSQQLPALDSLELAERRLEELQKLASTTASIKSYVQQQNGQTTPLQAAGKLHPVAPPAGLHHSQSATAMRRPVGGGGGLGGSMSGTEADFLVRQINTADVSQLSLFSNADEFESIAAGLDAGAMRGAHPSAQAAAASDSKMAAAAAEIGGLAFGGSESAWSANSTTATGGMADKRESGRYLVHKMGDALKDRIGALEAQIRSLTAAVQRKESELEKKDQKIRRLNADLENQRKDAVAELQQLKAQVKE